MKTLAKRGLTDDARAELAELVRTAQSLPAAPPVIEDEEADEEDNLAARLALHEWWVDWSTTAHAVVKKRSQLITLGLAARQSRAEDDTVVTGPPANGPRPVET